MTVDHLPGSPFARFSNPNYGPFGFFTAAQGFVLISGFVSGFVYEESRVRDGFGAMTRRVFARVRVLYVTQLVLYATLAVAVVAGLPGVSGWNLDVYVHEPWKGVFLTASLLYEPAYLGILPMYCMFLLATPFLIWQFARGRLAYVLAASACVWIAAGLLVRLPANPDGVDFGAFDPLSYQVVFVVGLAFGAKRLSLSQIPPRIRQWMVVGAAGVTTLFFALRLDYAFDGPVKPMIDRFSMAFSVVQLGPLRLLDFAAFAFLPLMAVPRLIRPGRTTAASRWLGFIGGHALPVFAWSILTTYAAMALLPSPPNTLIGLAAALVAVASLTIPATARAALLRRRAAGHAVAVASRSVRPPFDEDLGQGPLVVHDAPPAVARLGVPEGLPRPARVTEPGKPIRSSVVE
ncbi:hypothetical protein BJZ21_000895 [Nocardioides panaciterrulae]|uniref:OpgC domain-containing protein n=2 Tax=Nocardioides panaciterrulae TaxID=661492 RepID=A0A7Y9E4D8_9ACTN|nr:hypothetical protein [Nocardioides panaciterrulae]